MADRITIGDQVGCTLTGTYDLVTGGIKSAYLIDLNEKPEPFPIAASLIVSDGGKWQATFPQAPPGTYSALAVGESSECKAKGIIWRRWEGADPSHGVIVSTASNTTASGSVSTPTRAVSSGFHVSDNDPNNQEDFLTIINNGDRSWSATYAGNVSKPSHVVAVGNNGLVGVKEVS
jgi:hypothetical protein